MQKRNTKKSLNESKKKQNKIADENSELNKICVACGITIIPILKANEIT